MSYILGGKNFKNKGGSLEIFKKLCFLLSKIRKNRMKFRFSCIPIHKKIFFD